MKTSRTPKTSRLLSALDRGLDFATLGEYRVVVIAPEQALSERRDWADDVTWTQGPQRRSTPCRLPRAHQRGLTHARLRG